MLKATHEERENCRQFRRDITHIEVLESLKALLVAAQAFFDRYKQKADDV